MIKNSKNTDYYGTDGNWLIRDTIMVEWVDLGEGLSGDYNPEDKTDAHILRFDISVFKDGEWQDPGNASYATRFPADADVDSKKLGLKVIMDNVYDNASQGLSIKRIGEEMSWICIDDVRKFPHFFFVLGVISSVCCILGLIIGAMLIWVSEIIVGICLMIIGMGFAPHIYRVFRFDRSVNLIKEAYPQP